MSDAISIAIYFNYIKYEKLIKNTNNVKNKIEFRFFSYHKVISFIKS